MNDSELIVSRARLLKYLKVFLVIFIFGVILEIWIVNQLSIYGNKINQIKKLKDDLRLENQVLENQLAQKSSLSSIRERAQQYGFDHIKYLEYIPVNF